MKTWKLVSGIISIVLFAFVMFQSCAAGISNSLAENFIGWWNCFYCYKKWFKGR